MNRQIEQQYSQRDSYAYEFETILCVRRGNAPNHRNNLFFSNVTETDNLGLSKLHFPAQVRSLYLSICTKVLRLCLIHSFNSCTLRCWHPYLPRSFLRKFCDSYIYFPILQQYISGYSKLNLKRFQWQIILIILPPWKTYQSLHQHLNLDLTPFSL